MHTDAANSHTEPSEVKNRILFAAEELFADKGFAATTISDISDKAEVARALIYYHFKDKNGLYESIISEGGERIRICAQDALDSPGSTIEKIRVFLELMRQLHFDRPSHSKVAMRAHLEDSLSFDKNVHESFGRVIPLLRKIIVDGINCGELRNIDVDRTITLLMGIVNSLEIMQIHKDFFTSSDKDIDVVIEFIKHGISTT